MSENDELRLIICNQEKEIKRLEAELDKLKRANEIMKTALDFDYEYYEAKPHKCLRLLSELKQALSEIEGME